MTNKMLYYTFDLDLRHRHGCILHVYFDAPMVTRPFSSVIGMSPIGGFKNRFFFFCLFIGPTLVEKYLVAAN